MPRNALASAGFSDADVNLLAAGGIDLTKLWAFLQQYGPKVIPVILVALHTLPQNVWVKLIETLLENIPSP